MQSHFRDMWKHSAVYGLGQVLARLSSFLMLPVYTSYLRPADYGVIALLDFVGGPPFHPQNLTFFLSLSIL